MEAKVLIGHSYKMVGGKSIYRIAKIFEDNVYMDDTKTTERKRVSYELLCRWLKTGIWEEVLDF